MQAALKDKFVMQIVTLIADEPKWIHLQFLFFRKGGAGMRYQSYQDRLVFEKLIGKASVVDIAYRLRKGKCQ